MPTCSFVSGGTRNRMRFPFRLETVSIFPRNQILKAAAFLLPGPHLPSPSELRFRRFLFLRPRQRETNTPLQWNIGASLRSSNSSARTSWHAFLVGIPPVSGTSVTLSVGAPCRAAPYHLTTR